LNLTTKGTGIKQVKVFGKEFEKKTVFKRVCRSRFACAERLPPSKSRAFIFEKLDKYGRSYTLLLEDEKYSEVFMLATLPLKERDAKIRSGEDQLIDWETAKSSLRDSLK
jgi:hypothetical protein